MVSSLRVSFYLCICSSLMPLLEPDMSIWEVRNHKQNFVYSKVMLWVAFDRGLRLADKRCLPCPNRQKWLTTRDLLYEEIMEKGSFALSQVHPLPPISLPVADRQACTNRIQQGYALVHPKLRE